MELPDAQELDALGSRIVALGKSLLNARAVGNPEEEKHAASELSGLIGKALSYDDPDLLELTINAVGLLPPEDAKRILAPLLANPNRKVLLGAMRVVAYGLPPVEARILLEEAAASRRMRVAAFNFRLAIDDESELLQQVVSDRAKALRNFGPTPSP